MRILVVTSKFQPEYSGSGLRASSTYIRLNKKYKIQYDVLTSSLEYCGVNDYIYENVKIRRIAGYFKVANYKGTLRRIVVWLNLPFEVYGSYRYIKGRMDRYDMLHTFGDSWAVGFYTWYFSRFKKPVMRELCNEISTPYFPLPFRRVMKKLFTRDNMMMVAISPMLESLATKNSVKNIWQRPNPIDENKFNLEIRNKKMVIRARISPFSNKDIVLTYLAMFWRNKNQLFLLRVLSKLSNNYKLVLAGPVTLAHESYYNDVLAEIDNLNLNDRVYIVNKFIDNPQEYIAMGDVYLFPSRHEGLGTTILEAQACGVPIVMNELPGISDRWVNIGNAGYVSTLDEDNWVKNIHKAIAIEDHKLHENAQLISRVAGSETIDKEYLKKFNEICLDLTNEH